MTSLWSSRDEEEDRWSFRRSIRAVTLAAILQNIYQCVFLIVQTSNIFSLLENVRNKYVKSRYFQHDSEKGLVRNGKKIGKTSQLHII